MTQSSTPEFAVQEAAGQHARIGVAPEQAAQAAFGNPHPDAQWFAEAGLGLFIHWGISAVRGDGDLSWSMMAHPPGRRREVEKLYGSAAVQNIIPPETYWQQADHFAPDRYDPDKWLAAAKRAGFRYAAMTARHHDGYALWPSAHGDFSTRTKMGGRDLVGEFVAACRRHGLKVGIYYSPPDWYYERDRMSFRYGGKEPHLGTRHQPITLDRAAIGQARGVPDEEQRRYEEGFRAYLRGQVEELLTRYGQIDLIWFDGYAHEAFSIEWLRELQPGMVVSPRAHGSADYRTFECGFPAARPTGWWEYCHLWADGGWAYLEHETHKPCGWMISELARTRAWGGNFLPSLGPDRRGELPETAYRRLEELARWMDHSRASIFGVEPGPEDGRCNVPVTRRREVWYLHALADFDDAIEVRDVPPPVGVRLLRDGTALSFAHERGALRIGIPAGLRTTSDDVVEVSWASAPA